MEEENLRNLVWAFCLLIVALAVADSRHWIPHSAAVSLAVAGWIAQYAAGRRWAR